VPAAPGPTHDVVNPDESEPGTYNDRVLMERDPFAIIEAATIAGFAVGASKGWI
jgi:NADH-quinone oxidoreductase subunit F